MWSPLPDTVEKGVKECWGPEGPEHSELLCGCRGEVSVQGHFLEEVESSRV